jgi:xanthine dehydrogenase accessory factor
VLDEGAPLLLRVLPEHGSAFPDTPGAEVVVNPCLSGGALEIFLEPVLPPPLVEMVGSSPIADALERIAAVLGYETGRSLPARLPERAVAVVVCSHGRDETESIRAALDAGVGYVALVASRRRGEAVLDELGLAGDQRKQVRTPAGLDLGARTAEEIALSIMAEIVQAIRQQGVSARIVGSGGTASAPHQVTDPVCGMTVTVTADTPHLLVDGTEHWFCSTHCRDSFSATAGH